MSEIKKILSKVFFFVSIICVFSFCTNSKQKPLSSVVSGQTTIAVDESFQPICEVLQQAFQATYPNANLKINYISESESVGLMLADSADCILTGRLLSANEEKQAKSVNKVIIHSTLVATDAVAFILNTSNPDSLIGIEQLQKMLSGQITNWSSVGKTNTLGKIQVIIDRTNSSNLSYLQNKFGLSDSILHKNIYSAGSAEKTIDYVVKNKNAIGIIGYSWLSDQDNSAQSSRRRSVKLTAISNPKYGKNKFFEPSLGNIFTNQYPFCRSMYVANAEARVGLASGFISYMMSDIGQRIILKHGIKPIVNIQREVKFN